MATKTARKLIDIEFNGGALEIEDCRRCNHGHKVMWNGHYIGHLYKFAIGGDRIVIRKSAGCSGHKPAAMWDRIGTDLDLLILTSARDLT